MAKSTSLYTGTVFAPQMGDEGTSEPTHLSDELAGIIRKSLGSGTLTEANGDIDVPG